MTMVRIQAPKSESNLSSPIFAKIAVVDANAADKRAQKTQFDAVAMFGYGLVSTLETCVNSAGAAKDNFPLSASRTATWVASETWSRRAELSNVS